MPAAVAMSTATLDAAPTETMAGMAAINAFCTSSKPARPLTTRIRSRSGTSSRSTKWPIALSTALWRPMSSRTQSGSPSSVKIPAAWMPPVASKSVCAARRRSGSASKSAGRHSIGVIGGSAWSRSSIEALPQTPQAAVARNSRSGVGDGATGEAASPTRATSTRSPAKLVTLIRAGLPASAVPSPATARKDAIP